MQPPAWTLRGTCRYEPEPNRSLRGRIGGENHPLPIMRLRLAAQNLVMFSRKPTGFPPRFDTPVMAYSDVDEVTLLTVAPYCQPWRPTAKIKTLEATDVPFFIIFLLGKAERLRGAEDRRVHIGDERRRVAQPHRRPELGKLQRDPPHPAREGSLHLRTRFRVCHAGRRSRHGRSRNRFHAVVVDHPLAPRDFRPKPEAAEALANTIFFAYCDAPQGRLVDGPRAPLLSLHQIGRPETDRRGTPSGR